MFLLNYFRTPEIIDKVNKNTKEIPIYLSEESLEFITENLSLNRTIE